MLHKRIKDYFIPNKDNNYAPHSLQKVAMFGMVLLVVLSFTATNVQSLIWISSKWMVSTVLPAVIVDLTNQERGTQSLGTLTRSAILDDAAQRKADDMAKNQYFTHYSPDGVSPWYWFGQVSYDFVYAGENLAIHFTDSDDVIDAWMNSPLHRENIMNGNYTETGVGTAHGAYQGYQTVYVVQLFGTPSIAPAPVATSPTVAVEIVEELVQVDKSQSQTVLSESVSISEDVTTYEAKPVPVVVEETTLLESTEKEDTVKRDAYTTSTTVGVTDHGVALYSDFIATSTGGISASIDSSQISQSSTHASFLSILSTQPHRLLGILYILIGLFVFGLLIFSIFIEIRHQQPLQILYSVGLLILMGGLFYMQSIIGVGAIVV